MWSELCRIKPRVAKTENLVKEIVKNFKKTKYLYKGIIQGFGEDPWVY